MAGQGNYGIAPTRLEQCLCCGGPVTPGKFEVRPFQEEGEQLLAIGYMLGGEFLHVAWQLAYVEGEWTEEEAWADCQACADYWNAQL